MGASDAPELQVLDELDQKDAAATQARDHENYLKEVSMTNRKLSFLQTDTLVQHAHPKALLLANARGASELDQSERDQSEKDQSEREQFVTQVDLRMSMQKDIESAQDILLSLSQTIGDYVTTASEGDAELKSNYEGGWQTGEEWHQALLKTQEELNATHGSALELQGRLSEAKVHLEQRRDKLTQE